MTTKNRELTGVVIIKLRTGCLVGQGICLRCLKGFGKRFVNSVEISQPNLSVNRTPNEVPFRVVLCQGEVRDPESTSGMSKSTDT